MTTNASLTGAGWQQPFDLSAGTRLYVSHQDATNVVEWAAVASGGAPPPDALHGHVIGQDAPKNNNGIVTSFGSDARIYFRSRDLHGSESIRLTLTALD